MIFAQMLEIVALNDLASVLCARKFSFIIIVKALRLAAAVFMYFFNLAAAERPQHCALVLFNDDIYRRGKSPLVGEFFAESPPVLGVPKVNHFPVPPKKPPQAKNPHS